MRKFTTIMIVMIIFSFGVQDLMAIPAFARKYNMSCKTCHNHFPRLKEYGDEFAGNGFKLSDQDAPGYFVDTGDDELSLIRNFPIGARMEGHLNYSSEQEKGDFGTPWMLKILSGGEITEHLAYYFYFYMDEQGEIAGVEDAYLQFNNLFNTELDIYVGQFQVSDPLFKRELRLTLEDYMIYKTRPGASMANLTYDKGIMVTYGFDWGTDVVFEVVNGNGLVESDASKLFDADGYKSVVGRLSQGLGEFARVGLFAYSGAEDLRASNDDVYTNEVLMWGPDLTLSYSDILELNLQYLQRNDANLLVDPTTATVVKDFKTEGGIAELIYMPNGDDSKWYGVALLNYVDSDSDAYDYKSASFHLGYLLRRNLRMVGEYRFNFTDEDNPFNLFSFGFVLGV